MKIEVKEDTSYLVKPNGSNLYTEVEKIHINKITQTCYFYTVITVGKLDHILTKEDFHKHFTVLEELK